MPKTEYITLAASAARTASGNGDTFDLTPYLANLGMPPQLRVQSNVSAASGMSPSLTVLLEDSLDGGTTWNTICTFTAQTAVNRAVQLVGISGVAQAAGFAWPFNHRRIRCRWTISGTNPNFTFDVKAAVI